MIRIGRRVRGETHHTELRSLSMMDVDHPNHAAMDFARIFRSGRSQAVRLPRGYRFAGIKVIVQRFGNGVLLLPMDDPWQILEDGLAAFEPGFELAREQPASHNCSAASS